MFLQDPKNAKKSVSLTLLIISFIFLLILGTLQCFKIINDTGPFMEIFITTVSLYFGRRLNLGGLINKGNKK